MEVDLERDVRDWYGKICERHAKMYFVLPLPTLPLTDLYKKESTAFSIIAVALQDVKSTFAFNLPLYIIMPSANNI